MIDVPLGELGYLPNDPLLQYAGPVRGKKEKSRPITIEAEILLFCTRGLNAWIPPWEQSIVHIGQWWCDAGTSLRGLILWTGGARCEINQD